MTRTEPAGGGASGSPPEPPPGPLWAVVPAAGSGRRMARADAPPDRPERPKQYARLGGATLLEHALGTLLAVPTLAGAVVALAPDDDRWRTLDVARDPRVHVAAGAATRAGSVAAALARLGELAPPDARVLVHDAARPLVSLADIARLIAAVADAGAVGGLLGVPVQDTLKRADAGGHVVTTVPRERLWCAQTPQLFPLETLSRALATALGEAASAATITDEASAMERAGHAPLLVEAHDPNPKITRHADLGVAEALLGQRETACV